MWPTKHSLLKIKWLTNDLIPAEKSCLLCRFGSWMLHSPQQRWSRGWWNNFSGYCFLKPFLITLLGEALFKTLYPEKEKTELFQYISRFANSKMRIITQSTDLTDEGHRLQRISRSNCVQNTLRKLSLCNTKEGTHIDYKIHHIQIEGW